VFYIVLQFHLLDLDLKVNVVDSLIALITILVGLYICSSLQKQHNKNQNIYNYLISRLDTMWSDFNSVHESVLRTDKVQLGEVTKRMRGLQKKSIEFSRLSMQLVPDEKDTLSKLFDEYLGVFERSLIRDNICYYEDHHETIKAKGQGIVDELVRIFKLLNKI